MTVWLLTEGYNDYNQHGEYFVAVFSGAPSVAALMRAGVPENRAKHVQAGGGRIYPEDSWYNLVEVEPAFPM